jgi:N4-bis(aminopropyl)spermidine synthase
MFGFADRLETHLYNVFDALPNELLQTHDAFYTNPPYGASNHGASARLFITRGIELVRDGGEGFLILPDDATRPWTTIAMNNTRTFLERHGWRVTRHQRKLHQYHLDDDPTLASCCTSIKHAPQANTRNAIPWAGRRVPQDLIQHFYGKGVPLPFPKYIASDGQLLFEFDTTSPIGHPHDTSHLDFSGQSEQVQHPEVLTN